MIVVNSILCTLYLACFFLEYWKRKEVTLAYHWDVLEYEEEVVSVTIILNHIKDDLCVLGLFKTNHILISATL